MTGLVRCGAVNQRVARLSVPEVRVRATRLDGVRVKSLDQQEKGEIEH